MVEGFPFRLHSTHTFISQVVTSHYHNQGFFTVHVLLNSIRKWCKPSAWETSGYCGMLFKHMRTSEWTPYLLTFHLSLGTPLNYVLRLSRKNDMDVSYLSDNPSNHFTQFAIRLQVL
jgi:hypothetical protein